MSQITNVGQSPNTTEILNRRRDFSKGRLRGLGSSLEKAGNVKKFDDLSIYVAGSFGRLEGSENSDIDMFFVSKKPRSEYAEFHIPEIQALSEVIAIGYRLDFPKFSNDGEFLRFLFVDEMLKNLGSRADDVTNHFTARMLLLLESRPIFGTEAYNAILNSTIDSYFRDYPHHPRDFRPTFLINDILRFWKTLCLNYEHRRNQSDERLKVKQKVKNFKLKYSRLMTCFATVSNLCTYRDTISPKEVTDICLRTPVERLLDVAARCDDYSPYVAKILDSYAWFLEMTGMTTEDLEKVFSDKQSKQQAFTNAESFGNDMYELICRIDKDNANLRYLVI